MWIIQNIQFVKSRKNSIIIIIIIIMPVNCVTKQHATTVPYRKN